MDLNNDKVSRWNEELEELLQVAVKGTIEWRALYEAKKGIEENTPFWRKTLNQLKREKGATVFNWVQEVLNEIDAEELRED